MKRHSARGRGVAALFPQGDTWGVMSRPHIPKWYEGEAQLDNDWAMEEDFESEEIAMGDQ
jgi:hypothetical protein